MIYLFCGDDTKRKYSNYEIFLKGLPSRVEIFQINKNDFDRNQIESFYSGSGLFFKKCIVILTNVFEISENIDFVLGKLEQISKSENDFVFLEGDLSKSIIDDFKKVRAEINYFEQPKMKKEKYNNFLLANAFGARNKFLLWFHFREAMDRGVAMEELVGVLFWKAKDMITQNNFGKFKEEELKSFSSRLPYLLPEARKDGRDAEAEFEKFLLEIF